MLSLHFSHVMSNNEQHKNPHDWNVKKDINKKIFRIIVTNHESWPWSIWTALQWEIKKGTRKINYINPLQCGWRYYRGKSFNTITKLNSNNWVNMFEIMSSMNCSFVVCAKINPLLKVYIMKWYNWEIAIKFIKFSNNLQMHIAHISLTREKVHYKNYDLRIYYWVRCVGVV